MIRELEALILGQTRRLMLFLPPGSAKSTYASRLAPPWAFSRFPRLAIIGAANTAELARAFSGEAQALLCQHAMTLGVGVAERRVERWRTSNGGQYLAAGAGGTITGFRADLAIIDDPIRGAADADSPTVRERVWQWWLSDVRTRLRPGGRVALVMTRWHEDDLAGRLLHHGPTAWRVVKLPALAGEGDPLGRAPGAPLWADDDYGYGAELLAARAEYERSGEWRAWWSLYQQEPRSPEGLFFKVEKLGVVEAAPAGGRVVRGWDLAATEAAQGRDPDWTVGVKLTRHEDGRITVLDVVRLRGGPEDVEAAVLATAEQDGKRVRIGLAQDPGQAGKWAAQYLVRRLAGWTVVVSPETHDKPVRATPLASQVNVGNIALVQAAWNRPLIEELREFPTGRHDDQVDALARAFAMLTSAAPPPRQVKLSLMGR
jgi:predicted phage terminase large subunit-like protein